MTTQDTQHDHSDVDATVVEHPSAPEASVDSSASETTTPTEAEEQTNPSSIESAAPVPPAADDLHEKPAEASDEPAASPSAEQPQEASESAEKVVGETPTNRSTEEEERAQIQPPEMPPVADEGTSTSTEETPVLETPAAELEKHHVEFPYQDVLSLAKESEKEVRPFTAFIEEFRLAEEQARRHVSLPETTAEALSLLTPTENDLSAPAQDEATQETTAPVEETTTEVVLGQFIVETAETPLVPKAPAEVSAEASAPAQEAPTDSEAKVAESPAAETGEAGQVAAEAQPAPTEEVSSEAPSAEKSVSAPPPTERAVSPLLRPASRVRTPRHARHQREEAASEPVTKSEEIRSSTQDEQAIAEPAARVSRREKAEAEKAGAEIEKVKAEKSEIEKPETEKAEQPQRPPRRYRFDRPASSNTAATAASSARTEENKEVLSRAVSTARAETSNGTVGQPAEATAKTNGAAQSVEQSVSKQQTQEPTAQETAPAAPESSRRRGHDRQKENAASASTTPVVEPVNPVVEPAPMQLEEIAPEDLPPLEYAELQKTTNRRRRRHRSSSNSSSASAAAESAATPAAPSSPSSNASVPVPPAAPGAAPSAPAASQSTNGGAASSSNYSIVSGYTVSQMNQGNDVTGPFMGPDPSPARGSVLSRDGRTINRAETHRTPTPLYPGRAHTQEGGLTTAAFNQLTNSLVQALQNQTDRMVAELRRSNAAPTNVSVSLPPFPSTERVGVFVDVANLLYSARTLRISVDFGKLLDFLRGNRRLVRAHAYCPTSPQAGDEQMFLQAVKGLGYRITTKNYKTFSSGAKKADLDLDLCMDVVRLVDGRAVDCVVLVSGDSDFMPMLDYCSDHGVRVEVAAFDEAMSATLRQSCDLFVNLSMLEEIRS